MNSLPDGCIDGELEGMGDLDGCDDGTLLGKKLGEIDGRVLT